MKKWLFLLTLPLLVGCATTTPDQAVPDVPGPGPNGAHSGVYAYSLTPSGGIAFQWWYPETRGAYNDLISKYGKDRRFAPALRPDDHLVKDGSLWKADGVAISNFIKLRDIQHNPPPKTWKPAATGDIHVSGHASWFGGPNDADDDGETASGVDNSKMGVRGCALPMAKSNGEIVAECVGSPIPNLPYKSTLVEITCGAKVVTVPLIDVGPALVEDRPIDLTPSTFQDLGGDLDAGILNVTFRIIGGAAYLLP
jgi:hypothetical protein